MKIEKEFDPNSKHRRQIINLINNFSLETTPLAANKIANFSNFIRPETTIFITFLPGSDYKDTIHTAVKIKEEGLNPAPHFAARSILSKNMLLDYVSRITGEADVKKILIIGGASKKQLGPFPDTLSLLETGIFDKYGIMVFLQM